MIIKKAQYKKVRKLVEVRKSDEKYGCDVCRKEIKMDEKLELKVWPDKAHNTDVQYLHFCSWKCCFSYIPQIKSTYFADLPFLHFDAREQGLRAKDFIDLISQIPALNDKKKKATPNVNRRKK